MQMPEYLTVESLLTRNESYDEKLIQQSDDFYNAGINFPKGKYLTKSQIELSGSKAGEQVRSAKLAASVYIPIYASVIDYFVGSVTSAPLTILASGPAEKTSFYNSLNKTTSNARELLNLEIRHNAAFLSICSPDCDCEDYDVEGMTLQDQKALSLLDYKIEVLSAKDVIQYGTNSDGSLQWAKTYVVYNDRTNPDNFWEPEDKTVHLFTFFDSESVTEYAYETPLGKPVDKKALATRVSSKTHSLGVCPIIPCFPEIDIASRLLPLAECHFNRSSSLRYHLNNCAYPILSISSKLDSFAQVTSADIAALWLGDGGRAEYVKTDSAITDGLRSDFNDLENEMFKMLNATALNLNNTIQNNSRMSAKARIHEYSSLEVYLMSFAIGIIEAYEKALNVIKTVRGDDDVTIEITGCDEYDTNTLTSQIDLLKRLNEVKIAPTALKWAAASLSNKLVAEAPALIREQVLTENTELDIDDVIRPDAQSINAYVASGVISKDEARAMLGLDDEAPKMEVKEEAPETK